jgi:hypothetical protein
MQKATPPLADGNPQSKVFYLEPTAVRDDCDHESVSRRPRLLDLLKFTENNLDPLVSSKTYSSTE